MFSATKLLGGMMENGLGGGGMLGTAAKVAGVAAAGGLAYGAYKHYKAGGFGQGGPGLFGGNAQGQPPGAPAAGGNPFAGAQQPPAGGNPFAGAQQPPAGGNPFAGAQQAPAGGNPWGQAEPPPTPSQDEETQAMLLVRAMVTAAYVDGGLDDQERGNIMNAAAKAGMGDAERAALEKELATPKRPNVLFGEVEDPEMAKQIYLVTLLAIDRNSPVEQAYVAGLPLYLGITPADVAAIHQQLSI